MWRLSSAMSRNLSVAARCRVHVAKCVNLSSKVISESSQPPGGNLINLVAFQAARKHNAELQPGSPASKGKTGVTRGCCTFNSPCEALLVCACVHVRAQSFS